MRIGRESPQPIKWNKHVGDTQSVATATTQVAFGGGAPSMAQTTLVRHRNGRRSVEGFWRFWSRLEMWHKFGLAFVAAALVLLIFGLLS